MGKMKMQWQDEAVKKKQVEISDQKRQGQEFVANIKIVQNFFKKLVELNSLLDPRIRLDVSYYYERDFDIDIWGDFKAWGGLIPNEGVVRYLSCHNKGRFYNRGDRIQIEMDYKY